MGCTHVSQEMLNHPVIVRADDNSLDLTRARAIADEKARELSSDPMLLAWFDKKRGKFSPDVTCCGSDKPSWLVYAESRGADISVDINNEDYVFVYKAIEE
jgi:hypothetical protein